MFREGLVWNKEIYKDFISYLKSLKDDKYKSFSSKIVNTKYKMIGIKTPILRSISKDISKTNIESFFKMVGNTYYEEVLLYGLLLGHIKDKNTFDRYLYPFIKKIDNWAICDTCISSFKIMKKDESYYDVACSLLKEKDEFTIRVGLIIILDYYINDKYIDDIFKRVDSINSDYYYVNMAISWLISVCFIKYRDKALNYLKNNNLDKFTYNKAISKICDSYRVSISDKDVLKEMRK